MKQIEEKHTKSRLKFIAFLNCETAHQRQNGHISLANNYASAALGRYNACLDMLGGMLGGLKLTSYVSRHSWASAARQQNVPLSIISQSMGHDSEKTTEIYLKSLEEGVINKTNHDLLNNVFMGR